MINIETLTAGDSVIHKTGKHTTVLTGHYEDTELGWMIKTSLFPGGIPITDFMPAEHATAMANQVEPSVIFEVAIVEKEDPVKITAKLIREKAAPLMALTIESIFDEKRYEAVKKAKQKAVKMRTAIKSKEDEVLKAIKTRHGEEIKQVTDYTAELYIACLEAQNDLQGKLDKVDKERKEAADKISEEKKAKTDGRDAAMYARGMKFNGTGFMEYGKYIGQDVLHAMSDEKYVELLVEIDGLSMEQAATGTAAVPAAVPEPARAQDNPGFGWAPNKATPGNPNPGGRVVNNNMWPHSVQDETLDKTDRVYDTAIYERAIPELGARLIITNGTIEAEPDAIVANDCIKESYYFVQIVR